jgi:hypothetical protein
MEKGYERPFERGNIKALKKAFNVAIRFVMIDYVQVVNPTNYKLISTEATSNTLS